MANELETAASQALDEAMAKFPLRNRPVVEWRPYRVTAGMAYYKVNKIGLSKYVLTNPTDVRETLLHEYAHLLAVERHGVKAANHGLGWRQAMIDLGLTPRVRHNMPVERNTKRQAVVYKCLKCGAEIVRARKLPKRRKYHHVNCGGAIRLARIESLTSPPDKA